MFSFVSFSFLSLALVSLTWCLLFSIIIVDWSLQSCWYSRCNLEQSPHTATKTVCILQQQADFCSALWHCWNLFPATCLLHMDCFKHIYKPVQSIPKIPNRSSWSLLTMIIWLVISNQSVEFHFCFFHPHMMILFLWCCLHLISHLCYFKWIYGLCFLFICLFLDATTKARDSFILFHIWFHYL